MENELSTFLPVTYAVPQCIILDPLLFIIYVNGILNLKIKVNVLLMCFGNDTIILVKDNTKDGVLKLAT